MSNMTPFEIRLELLKMARDMLYDSYNAERDRLSQDWNIKCETAKAKGEIPPEHPALPTVPSEQEIISKAQTLNGFVSNIQQAEPVVKVTNKKVS
jgi:hypothetical protein